MKPACQDPDGQGSSAFPPLSSSPNNVFSQHQWDEVGWASQGLELLSQALIIPLESVSPDPPSPSGLKGRTGKELEEAEDQHG